MNTESRHWLILAVLTASGFLIYLLAPVITPFASTVTTGIKAADPYVPAVTPEAGKSALTKDLNNVGASAPAAGPP